MANKGFSSRGGRDKMKVRARAEALGLSPARAMVRAGAIRLRPILMTTSTTVLGMTPLALAIGSGAEIMQPLALCVIGGLLVSMLLTLLVIPCLYLIVGTFAERLKAVLLARPAEVGESATREAGQPRLSAEATSS